MNPRGEYRHPLLRSYVQVLRFLGLWNLGPNTSALKSRVYLIYKCVILFAIITFIAALTVDLVLSREDLLVMTDDGCILAGLSVILFKLINFQIYPKKVERLLKFVDDNVRILHQEGSSEHLRIWRRHLLRERVTIYSFATIGMFLVLALMLFTSTEPGDLPIRSEYFIDVKKSPLHQVMFVYQGSVLTISMLSILTMDNMVLDFCSQIFCHFEILKLNFRDCVLVDKPTKNFGQINIDENSVREFKTKLTKCIRRHQEIIEFVLDLDAFFSPLMFVQLLASNVLICLTGFQAILVVGQNSGFTKFAIYLSAAFSQLFYWCWCGNELIHQSASVADVLWLIPWEYVDDIKSIKSLLTITLMRLKKPLKLTAGKFYIMSMETFISVLSGSYSFFTLLNKMNEPVN